MSDPVAREYFLDAYVLTADAGETTVFLYGSCWPRLAHDYFPAQVTYRPEIIDVNGIGVRRVRCVLSLPEFLALDSALQSGSIDLLSLNLTAKSTRVRTRRRAALIQLDSASESARAAEFPAPESIFPSMLSRTTVYWIFSDLEPQPKAPQFSEHLRAHPSLPVSDIAHCLQNCTGLSFTGAYSQRIGCFEIHELPHEESYKYHMSFPPSRESGDRRQGVQIHRTYDAAHDTVIVGVRLRNIHDIIVDRIVLLPEGVVDSEPVFGSEDFSEYSVSIHRLSDGELLFHERRQILRGISLTHQLVAHTVEITDNRLSKHLRPPLRKKLETQVRGVTTATEVKLQDAPLIEGGLALQCLVNSVTGRVGGYRSPPARLFQRGDEGQVDFILYLQELCAAETIVEVLIADPFFESAAVERLLPRLSSVRAPVTVLTSLAERTFPLYESEKIARLCANNQQVLPPQLKIVSVTRGSDQAFHDRYACIRRESAAPLVLLLSNSINKAAGRWSLCVAPVTGEAVVELEKYLLGLLSGKDTLGSGTVSMSTVWPAQVIKSHAPVLSASVVQSRSLYETLRPIRADQELVESVLTRLRFQTSLVETVGILAAIGEVLYLQGAEYLHHACSAVTGVYGDVDVCDAANALCNIYSEQLSFQAEGDLFVASAKALLSSNELRLESFGAADTLISRQVGARGPRVWGLEFALAVLALRYPQGISLWIQTSPDNAQISAASVVQSWLAGFHGVSADIAEKMARSVTGPLQYFLLVILLGGSRHRGVDSYGSLGAILDNLLVPEEEQHWLITTTLLFALRRGDYAMRSPLEIMHGWPECVPSDLCKDDVGEALRKLGGSISFAALVTGSETAGVEAPMWIYERVLRECRDYLDEGKAHAHLHDFDANHLAALGISSIRTRGDKPCLRVLPNHTEFREMMHWALWPLARRSAPERWATIRTVLCSAAFVVWTMREDKSMGNRFFPVLVELILLPAAFMISRSQSAEVSDVFRVTVDSLLAFAAQRVQNDGTVTEALRMECRRFYDAGVGLSERTRGELSRLIGEPLDSGANPTPI